MYICDIRGDELTCLLYEIFIIKSYDPKIFLMLTKTNKNRANLKLKIINSMQANIDSIVKAIFLSSDQSILWEWMISTQINPSIDGSLYTQISQSMQMSWHLIVLDYQLEQHCDNTRHVLSNFLWPLKDFFYKMS